MLVDCVGLREKFKWFSNILYFDVFSPAVWIITIFLTFVVIFGDSFAMETRPWIYASFNSSTHIMWLFVLIWIIVASTAGCGGKKIVKLYE